MSELSNDMRVLRAAVIAGNEKARLAVDKFTWAVVTSIGGFFDELGGLDTLVFTGGIGENDIATRTEICAGLSALGVVLDPLQNDFRGAAVISAGGSAVQVRVIPPAEDLMIVNHVTRMLADHSSAHRSTARAGNADREARTRRSSRLRDPLRDFCRKALPLRNVRRHCYTSTEARMRSVL